MVKKTSTAVIALFAASLIVTSAYAHPTLKSANPPVDGTANAPLTELRLNFSEAIVLNFSSVELQDQGGMKIVTGKIATDAKDGKQLIVPLQAPLKAGKYTVKWTIVSADTHRMNGTYSFNVAL